MAENVIPADVIMRARERASAMYPVNSAGNEAVAEMITCALLAERERCGKIADQWAGDAARMLAANVYGLSDRDIDTAQNTARGIAEAIRGGSHE